MGEFNDYSTVATAEVDIVQLVLTPQEEHPFYRILNTFVNPAVLVFGVLINALFVFISARIDSMRTATNFFLINLAFADIGFLLFGIGEKSLRYWGAGPEEQNFFLNASMFGANGCGGYQLVTTSGHFGSLFLFTLISFDRFYCVRNIRRVKIRRKRGQFLVATAICWILAVLVAFSFLPSFTEVHLCGDWTPGPDTGAGNASDCSVTVTACQSVQDSWLVGYRKVMQTVPFFLCAPLNFLLYWLIVRRLNASYPPRPGPPRGGTERRHNQITKMLVINGTLYFCLLFPFQFEFCYEAIQLYLGRRNGSRTFLYIREMSLSLVYVNAAISPLIYVLVSSQYQSAFRKVFRGVRCGGREASRARETTDDNRTRISVDSRLISVGNKTITGVTTSEMT